MGCLARLGCLLLIVAAGIAAWLTRDRWMPQQLHRGTSNTPSAAGPATTTTTDWQPLSEEGANRTAQSLKQLSSPRGPVFATLQGADIASYIALQVARTLQATSDSFAARVNGETVSVRALVDTKELGPALGALGTLFGGRQWIEMSGTLSVLEKGIAEFRIKDLSIGKTPVPSPLIPQLLKPLVKNRPKGLDENGLPISIPPYVGDVRVAHGKITLYKNVQ